MLCHPFRVGIGLDYLGIYHHATHSGLGLCWIILFSTIMAPIQGWDWVGLSCFLQSCHHFAVIKNLITRFYNYATLSLLVKVRRTGMMIENEGDWILTKPRSGDIGLFCGIQFGQICRRHFRMRRMYRNKTTPNTVSNRDYTSRMMLKPRLSQS